MHLEADMRRDLEVELGGPERDTHHLLLRAAPGKSVGLFLDTDGLVDLVRAVLQRLSETGQDEALHGVYELAVPELERAFEAHERRLAEQHGYRDEEALAP